MGKTTKRERKQAAKQRRVEEMRRRQRQVRLRKIYVSALVVAALGGIAAWAIASRASSSKAGATSATLARAAGCNAVVNETSEGFAHVADGQRVTYRTNPPTSGSHWANPATTGLHATPVQDEQQVHNLEHGHVVIQYVPGGIDAATVSALESLVQTDPKRILLAPRPSMPFKLAFTAWTELEGCAGPTTADKIEAAAKDFMKRFKGKGREGDIPGTPVFETPPAGASATPTASASPKKKPSPGASAKASPGASASPSPSPSNT